MNTRSFLGGARVVGNPLSQLPGNQHFKNPLPSEPCMKLIPHPILALPLLLGVLLLASGCQTPTVTLGTPAKANRCELLIRGAADCAVNLKPDIEVSRNSDAFYATPMLVVFDITITRELEMRKSFVDAEVVLELLGPGASTCRFVTGPGTKGVRMVWTGSAWQGEVF